MDNKALFNLSYGLFVVTAREGEKDNGCIINTVTQATSSPVQITIAVNKQNYTHDMILRTGSFNVSILSEKADVALFKHFGFQSGRETDKCSDEAPVKFRRSENGLVYLTENANAYLSAKVKSSVDLGSHTLFIAEVTDAEVLNEEESVTYAYYHKNIKPKPEKTSEEKKGWICTICGYIYEGEVLPEDFVCPICKHPASDFKKL